MVLDHWSRVVEPVPWIVSFYSERAEAPNAPKLSDRLWEPATAGTEREQAGTVRGATPAGAQAVAGAVTGAAPAAVESP